MDFIAKVDPFILIPNIVMETKVVDLEDQIQ
jgi:hypothetical protein